MERYHIVFPSEDEPLLHHLPWEFQKRVMSHQWWNQGCRLRFDSKNECWVLEIGKLSVDKMLPLWKEFAESVGAVIVKTVKRANSPLAPFINSKEYKHWLRTGEKPSDLH